MLTSDSRGIKRPFEKEEFTPSKRRHEEEEPFFFPDEIYLAIFQNLPLKDLLNSSLVCKKWAILSTDHFLWNPLFRNYFKKECSSETRDAKEQFRLAVLEEKRMEKEYPQWLIESFDSLHAITLLPTLTISIDFKLFPNKEINDKLSQIFLDLKVNNQIVTPIMRLIFEIKGEEEKQSAIIITDCQNNAKKNYNFVIITKERWWIHKYFCHNNSLLSYFRQIIKFHN